jgi:hypothetical protein
VEEKTVEIQINSEYYDSKHTGPFPPAYDHLIVLDPDDLVVFVRSFVTRTTTPEFQKSHEIVLGEIPDGVADTSELVEDLESDAIQMKLLTIADGHSVRWDGHRDVDELDEEAEWALGEIERGIERLMEEPPTYLSPWEGLSHLTIADFGLSAASTPEEIAEMSEEYAADQRELEIASERYYYDPTMVEEWLTEGVEEARRRRGQG